MLNFNRYTLRSTGERVAKISVEFVIDRADLVRATEVAIVDLLPASIDASDVELAAKVIKRSLVENTLRDICHAYGEIYFDSGDHDLSCGEFRDMVRVYADDVVSRLYPELTSSN